MLITIDTAKDTQADIRALIGFLAHMFELEPSDVEDVPVPLGTTPPKEVALAAATVADAGVMTAAAVATLPNVPTASNVLPFTVPPPPASVGVSRLAAIADVPAPRLTPATTAAVVPNVASATTLYDSAGMPWDGRIHQRGMAQKKDGTWKLQKGIDTAIVQAVVMELSVCKVATPQSPSVTPQPQLMVPPPPPVTLHPTNPTLSGTEAPTDPMSLPPIPIDPTATHVPSPPISVSVPLPPVSPAGTMGVTYRSLIDKMTSGTPDKRLTADKVLGIVHACGCPNLQQLNKMPQIWADVDAKLDLVLAGLM